VEYADVRFRLRCNASLELSIGGQNRHSCDYGSIRLCSSAARSCSSYFDWCAFFVYLHLRFTPRLLKRNRSPARTATKQARVRTAISSEARAASERASWTAV
jgi:hypothetical protein